MSTAFVFAPLTAFLRSDDRLRYRDLPEVQERFAEAEAILQDCRVGEFHLNDLLEQPTEVHYSRSRIDVTPVLIIAMQLGIVDRLEKIQGKPAWVAGCSVGDVARTIAAGACSFDAALRGVLVTFRHTEGADKIGSSAAVMTSSERPFTDTDLAWFSSVEIAVTQLSKSLLNVSGRSEAMRLLADRARSCRWRTYHLSDYPLHSPHLAEYTGQAREMMEGLPVQAPTRGIRVYSSLLGREIDRREDFCEEFALAFVASHNWTHTVADLVDNHRVTTFVNVGPCRTLSWVLRQMEQTVYEAEDVIRSGPGATA